MVSIIITVMFINRNIRTYITGRKPWVSFIDSSKLYYSKNGKNDKQININCISFAIASLF